MENVTDSFTQDRVPDDKAPGWYPDRISPNVQRYWDGTAWIAQRRWVNAQWVNEPPPVTFDATGGVVAGSGAAALRPNPTTRPVTTPALTPAAIGVFCCSVLLIVGSFTPWVTVSFAAFSGSASGTDGSISDLIGVNGWITFAGGLLLLILFCLMAINPQPLFRSLTLIVAVVVAGFAVYDLVRIVQKISQASSVAPAFSASPLRGLRPDITVGWGLIVLAIAAVGALACAIAQARSS